MIGLDRAHLTGAYAVAQWLASQANEARASGGRGLDAETCAILAAGAEAMVTAMSARSGLNPDGCDATDWPAGDAKVRELAVGPDLDGVHDTHLPGLAADNLIPGLVYCKRCCHLLTSVTKGLTRRGRTECDGPARLRPMEPIGGCP